MKAVHPDAPSSEEFVQTLGQVTWLMTLSSEYRDKNISFIEAHVSAPLMFNQVRIYLSGKQPIGAVTWAYASPEVKAKVEVGALLCLEDWRSGPEVMVVDCISPLVDKSVILEKFSSQVAAAKENSSKTSDNGVF